MDTAVKFEILEIIALIAVLIFCGWTFYKNYRIGLMGGPGHTARRARKRSKPRYDDDDDWLTDLIAIDAIHDAHNH